MLGASSTDFPSTAFRSWRGAGRGHPLTMNDLIFISLSVAFFVIAALYTLFCEKVR